MGVHVLCLIRQILWVAKLWFIRFGEIMLGHGCASSDYVGAWALFLT